MKHHLSWRRRLLSMLLALAMVATVVPATAGAIGAEDTGEFLNGPYLMTPKSDSMVVVWALDEPVKSTHCGIELRLLAHRCRVKRWLHCPIMSK